MTIIETIKKLKSELSGIYPKTEIESFVYIIFEHLLKYSKIDIHTKQNEVLSNEIDEKIQDFVFDLKKHRPIQYIIGNAEFYGLNFLVNQSVLIPRPETEELVELVIRENKHQNVNILDIGTGSGCIAISLVKNINKSIVFAYDISTEAIETAKKNASLNNVCVEFKQVDILNFEQHIFPEFDIIVTNPPYVGMSEKQMMQKNVLNYEPHLALFISDEKPLIFYHRIADFAQQYLKANGKIYFEINEKYGNETKDMLENKLFRNVEIVIDINGKNRFVKAQK
ncbi:MAG TPA: peptide chain release factor N(5)-glutamine methyltransferase [Bacteroidales bacterium]|nr:MAG: protein-(glutamine-N5) methyltransferase, release factor-specific [Bacteroidetes bacterium GWF2_33_38]OFY91491.1 MAG: protein-(glutamine-N5) methyltransferase, release factor-specific [Bacteroidetes bacterium RIFOXYA2_FULL_33_7]HBF88013.1 peptide chain release factor N(5)-glutamine methyltransferase [Bacteroidales bacterium]